MADDRLARLALLQCWSETLTRRTKISIVDDDRSFREAIAGLMTSYGYDAQAFESAMSFLGSDRRHATDCLIADVHMPGMTGLELHQRLAISNKPIPTILITGRHEQRLRAQVLRAGVLCYLTKPFDEDDLLRCIAAALGRSGAADGS